VRRIQKGGLSESPLKAIGENLKMGKKVPTDKLAAQGGGKLKKPLRGDKQRKISVLGRGKTPKGAVCFIGGGGGRKKKRKRTSNKTGH